MRVKFDPTPKHTYVHAPVMSEADTGIEFRVGGASLANVQVEESVRTAIITSVYYMLLSCNKDRCNVQGPAHLVVCIVYS